MSITVKYKKGKETSQKNTTGTDTINNPSTINSAAFSVYESAISACFLLPKE